MINQITFNQISQSAIYRKDNISVSITCCGGSYGGGSEVLVVGTITMNSYQVITDGEEPIAPILSSDAHRGGGVAVVMSYQNATGTLNPGGHPGSYNGQDAYNDMLVVDDGISNGIRSSKCRNNEGGVSNVECKS